MKQHLLTAALLTVPMTQAVAWGYDPPGHYAVLGYYGYMTKNTLGEVIGMNWTLDSQALYSGEISYVFLPCQGMRRYFGPLFNSIEANFNITYHDDHDKSLFEFIPYLSFRWNCFPWTKYLHTSLALGEGISWISDVSTREYRNSEDPKKLLNYLMFEVTFAAPCYPQLELVGRIHHRSGVFGMYRANNSGSTAVGLALRYYFGDYK